VRERGQGYMKNRSKGVEELHYEVSHRASHLLCSLTVISGTRTHPARSRPRPRPPSLSLV
jgi:hypothetical protein